VIIDSSEFGCLSIVMLHLAEKIDVIILPLLYRYLTVYFNMPTMTAKTHASFVVI